MAEDRRDPQRQTEPAPDQPAGQRPFAEPQPFEIVVVEQPSTTPVVVEGTAADTAVKVRKRLAFPTWLPEGVHVPPNFWLLLAVAATVLILSWHWVLSPFVAHAEHSLQRRIYGERTYDAPTSNPHVHRQKHPILGFRIW